MRHRTAEQVRDRFQSIEHALPSGTLRSYVRSIGIKLDVSLDTLRVLSRYHTNIS